jgi:hypothetical protein
MTNIILVKTLLMKVTLKYTESRDKIAKFFIQLLEFGLFEV